MHVWLLPRQPVGYHTCRYICRVHYTYLQLLRWAVLCGQRSAPIICPPPNINKLYFQDSCYPLYIPLRQINSSANCLPISTPRLRLFEDAGITSPAQPKSAYSVAWNWSYVLLSIEYVYCVKWVVVGSNVSPNKTSQPTIWCIQTQPITNSRYSYSVFFGGCIFYWCKSCSG